jgi:hypothetical protein
LVGVNPRVVRLGNRAREVMMAVPTGKIVDRPMVARACGCRCEFQHYEVDKYRSQRLAKFQQTRCPACVAKLEDERRQAVAARPARGEALAALPIGTQVMLVRRPDGLWAGTLRADGAEVEAVADGPRPLVTTLAQLWAVEKAAGG